MIDVMLVAPFSALSGRGSGMKAEVAVGFLNIASIHATIASVYSQGCFGQAWAVRVNAHPWRWACPYGITVNAICAGSVDMPLVRNQLHDLARRIIWLAETHIRECHPAKCANEATDRAGRDRVLALFSVGRRASITAPGLYIDGGLSKL